MVYLFSHTAVFSAKRRRAEESVSRKGVLVSPIIENEGVCPRRPSARGIGPHLCEHCWFFSLLFLCLYDSMSLFCVFFSLVSPSPSFSFSGRPVELCTAQWQLSVSPFFCLSLCVCTPHLCFVRCDPPASSVFFVCALGFLKKA